jgi:ketosteroid isomerase-like protein
MPDNVHIKQLVADAFVAWQAGTGTAFDLLAEDVSWTITGSHPLSATYESKAALMAGIDPLFSRLATPFVPTAPELYVDGDTVVALFHGGATANDGKPYENTYSWYMTFTGDEITRVVAFFDGLKVVELFERVPAPA